MKRTICICFSLCVVALVMLESDFAIGQTPVFGPEAYIRETGKPQKTTKNFPVQNSNEEFTLVVQNGEGKRGRVSSAIIELNGTQVVGPDEFNKQVDLIKKPVTLQSQNELTVEVRSQPGTSLNVTILGPDTTTPSPVSGITVNPDGFPINTPTQVTFTADIPYQPGGPVPTVVLEQVSQTGSVVAVEGTMVDDGQISLGDEIQGDGVFSFRKTYDITQPGDTWLRVKADVDGQLFYSDTFTLLAFTPLSDVEADAISSAQTNAQQLYQQILPVKGDKKAMAEVLVYLKSLPIVEDAGISEAESSIWIRYTNGIEGGILTNPPGTKGGSKQVDQYLTKQTISSSVSFSNSFQPLAASSNNQVQSTKVLLLSPFLDEFGSNDEGPALKEFYNKHNTTSGCPTYDVVYLENSQAGVNSFKALGKYGIIHISSHGTVLDKLVVVLTKTSASAQNLKNYQADLLKKRLVSLGNWLAVKPLFFEYYIKSMPSSLIFFSSCKSTFNDSMWKIFLDKKGAKAYLGFSETVPSYFAYEKANYFHKEWVEDAQNLTTTGEVFNNGCISNGKGGTACWNLLGAKNLEAPPGDQLQNGGFESGTLSAWSSQGDGRVVKQLGTFSPTEGNRMGIVSTGLGYTTDSGSISQKVCIPPDVKKLKFDWNFNSEEFREFCGSIFQDFFRVDLVNASGGTTNLFYRKVDDLCANTFHVPFSFDRGDVWSTDWNSESIDISGFVSSNAGKAVTIKFSTGDIGDSIYDTAVLLDNIRISP